MKSISPSLGHKPVPTHVRTAATHLLRPGALCAARVLGIFSALQCTSSTVMLVLIRVPSSGCSGTQQPLLFVAAIATDTTDWNGREGESEGCKGPISFMYSFPAFSESTNLELSGCAFPLGLTGSTDQQRAQNVGTSISLPFSKVQAVFLQEMAADDTIIVKVRLSYETEEGKVSNS